MKPSPADDPDPAAHERDNAGRSATGRRAGAACGAVLFAYGFRPFFLLAPIYAVISIAWWIATLYTSEPASPAWHAHEMLYGFVAAAVGGFLLTAVPSWTGRRGYAGLPLAALALLWLAGRLAMTLGAGTGAWWSALFDLAFVPALALTLLPALLREGKRRNLVFILLLALLFTANLQFHLAGAVSTAPLHLGLNTMLFLLTLLGGRIVPAFTSAGLKQRGIETRIERFRVVDSAALIAVGAVLAVDLLAPGGTVAGAAAAGGALLLALQLLRWQGYRCAGDALLWVLHLAYAWLPVSLALKAAALFGLPLPANAWVHALTTGAMATMIIGVMSRASLGHTGRALVAPASLRLAYLALSAAALARVFGPLLYPSAALSWLTLSAALWCLAFTVFVVIFAPILCRPRADGRPG